MAQSGRKKQNRTERPWGMGEAPEEQRAMMIDPFVLLTPVLLLAVIALL